MKLGVNNSVNLETKKVGARLMDGGKSKIDRPTAHPSNPIHKLKPQIQFTQIQIKNNPHRKPKVRKIMKF